MRPTPKLRGAGGRNHTETGQSITPRPLERWVGWRTRKEWLLLFAFRSCLLLLAFEQPVQYKEVS